MDDLLSNIIHFFWPMELDNFFVCTEILPHLSLYKSIGKSHKSIIFHHIQFIQILHIFPALNYSPNKMAANKNAFPFLYISLFLVLTILLIQQHFMQVDGQQCKQERGMLIKCSKQNIIFIYAISDCPPTHPFCDPVTHQCRCGSRGESV